MWKGGRDNVGNVGDDEDAWVGDTCDEALLVCAGKTAARSHDVSRQSR